MATEPALAATPFDHFAGSWSGAGRIIFEGGQTERLRCNASYRSTGGGHRLGLSIRCASPSTSFEMLGNLAYRDGRVSGTWEERTLGASGGASGRASASRIALRFNGSANGSISVSLSGSGQAVTVTSYGTALRAINVSLRRR
jgi:hypothetical protein